MAINNRVFRKHTTLTIMPILASEAVLGIRGPGFNPHVGLLSRSKAFDANLGIIDNFT